MFSIHSLKKLAVMGAIVAVAAIVPSLAPAQLDWEVVVSEAEGTALSGDSTAEFDGVAVVTTDTVARIWVFDSVSGYDALNTKQEGGPLSTFATEAELAGGSASYTHMAADSSGNLYGLWFTGSNTVLYRTPASSPFSSSVEMVPTGTADNAFDLAVDEFNSELLFAYEDIFSVVTEDIVSVPLNASGATPTVAVSEAVLQAAADTVGTANDIDVVDFDVQSDGTIIVSHGFPSSEDDSGTIIAVTGRGGSASASVIGTPEDLVLAAGGVSGDLIGQVSVDILSDDKILCCIRFLDGANTGLTAPALVLGQPDGSSWTLLADQATVSADPDMAPFGDLGQVDSKNAALDKSNDNYYWTQQRDFPDPQTVDNGVIKMTGIRAFITSNVDNWNLY